MSLVPGSTTPGTVLLAGVVGSTAYGLATPTSDVDHLGMYAAPTLKFLGLHPPTDANSTITQSEPDVTYHEVLKYVRLVLKGNPTVTELLWLDEYEVQTPLGMFLVNRRTRLLCAKRVRDSYLGYATSQFTRLVDRGDGSFSADTRKRTAKHARHLLRLLHQGVELYTTGQLTIRLADPQQYFDFGEDVAAGNHQRAREALATAEHVFDTKTSVLATEPDEALVDGWLRAVRLRFWPDGFARGT